MSVEVIHRDAHMLVVNKPSGLPTTGADGSDCLVERVRLLDPDAPKLHASSRLDAEVTGLVTFARTRHGNRTLMDARERGFYRRRYVALAQSAPQPAEGRWCWRIDVDPTEPRRRVALASDTDTGRDAETRYRTRVAFARVAVLDLHPQTGRTHQLRVHAAQAACPLLGDRLYGGEVRFVAADGRVSRARRVMLHCAEVCVPNAEGGADLVLRAPAPDDMQALLDALAPDAADVLRS